MQKNIDGKRVKELREKMEISQTTLSKEVGVTYQIIGKIENGRIKSPSAKTAMNLAKALGTTISYLYGEEGFSKSSNPDVSVSKIPLLDFKEAAEWCKTGLKEFSEEGHSFINCPEDLSISGVFALRITTDSMEGYGSRQAPMGSIAILKPTGEVKSNKFILFYNKLKNTSILREAVIEDELYLKPLNSRYETRIKEESLTPIAEVLGIYFNP